MLGRLLPASRCGLPARDTVVTSGGLWLEKGSFQIQLGAEDLPSMWMVLVLGGQYWIGC